MPSPPNAGFQSRSQKADLPESIQKLFRDLRFIPVNPTNILDFDAMEILLIGATQDIKDELGESGEALEEWEAMEEPSIKEDTVLEELDLSKDRNYLYLSFCFVVIYISFFFFFLKNELFAYRFYIGSPYFLRY